MRREEKRRATTFGVSPRTSHLTPHFAAAALVVALAGCGTAPRLDTPTAQAPSAPRGGGYYLDDGPGANPPADLDGIPDAVPRAEPIRVATSRPYTVMGRSYTPMTALEPYKARGIATWYGRRYHGKPTSSGEIYDMYAMTAAHTTLPIPSYARVTHLASGKSVVVRVNDRGPFVDDRVIDLSQAAARELGYEERGLANVRVEFLGLDDGSGRVPPTRPAATAVASIATTPLDEARPRVGEVVRASLVTPDPAVGGRALVTEATAVADHREAPSQRPTLVTSYQAPAPARSCAIGAQFVQVGAFGDTERVRFAQAELAALGPFRTEPVFVGNSAAMRVRLGPSADLAGATRLLEQVRERGYVDAYLVPVDPRAPRARC
jgi:rare lipoprotein A